MRTSIAGSRSSCLGPRQHGALAGFGEDPQGAGAHLRVRVVEQAAHGGVRGRAAAESHHVERVEDLPRVRGGEPRGEDLLGLAVHDRRVRPLGVDAVLLQRLLERRHVAAVHARGEDEPRDEERDVDEGHRHRAPTPPKVASARTASPARPSPARQTTVSMKDFAGSFATVGTGR